MFGIHQILHFNRLVSFTINTLELHDRELAKTFSEAIAAQFGAEFTAALLTASVVQLAERNPSTCQWTLQNLYTPEDCAALREGTLMVVVQELLKEGFVLGKDFSTLPNGKLLLTSAAKSHAPKHLSPLDRLLLDDILLAAD
ncbi:MAG TPA: hypothetical protein IGS37_09710 [Synechococcales cyanobacterium M55_K2018_004]|nr:hypothetical protein [Synechococcales cyanobacterium M55_K2018_004]